MKTWLIRIGQVALGAFAGSLVLENLTRFTVVQLVPRIHDVQFALLITIISTIGGIFGAVTAVSLLAVMAERDRLAGWHLSSARWASPFHCRTLPTRRSHLIRTDSRL